MTYFQRLISELIATGLSQSEISRLVKPASQGQIGDLLSGRKTEPLYALGARLVALHNRRRRTCRQAA